MKDENFFSELPFPAALINKQGKLLATNKNWARVLKKLSPDFSLLDEKLLIANDYGKILERVFKGEINLRTKPIFCTPDYSILSKIFAGKYIIFNVYPVHETPSYNVCCIIEDLTDPLDSEFHLSDLNSRKTLSGKIFKILEAERKRMARELHDEIIQRLLIAKLEIDLFQKTPDPVPEKLDGVKQNLLEISKDIRSLIQALHPVILEEEGLIKAIELLISKINTSASLKIHLDIFGDHFTTDKNIELNVFRIIQEALSNIKKHSSAKNANVQLHFNENILIGSVHDDGIGFSKGKLKNNKGYGITSMKERARALNGDLGIESEPKKGTKVIFHIPWGKENYETN